MGSNSSQLKRKENVKTPFNDKQVGRNYTRFSNGMILSTGKDKDIIRIIRPCHICGEVPYLLWDNLQHRRILMHHCKDHQNISILW